MQHTLRTSVHDDFRCELEEDKFEQAQGKCEACPIMSVFQNLQTIAIELDVSIKVHVVESLHGDLVCASVLELVGLILECKVVLDRAPGVSGFLVLARTEPRMEGPECNENGDCCKEAEEDSSLQSTPDFPGHVEGNETKKGEQENVGE